MLNYNFYSGLSLKGPLLGTHGPINQKNAYRTIEFNLSGGIIYEKIQNLKPICSGIFDFEIFFAFYVKNKKSVTKFMLSFSMEPVGEA